VGASPCPYRCCRCVRSPSWAATWVHLPKRAKCWTSSKPARWRRFRSRCVRSPIQAPRWTTCAPARSSVAPWSPPEEAPMQITVMGSGGVGGYFGARLAAAGNDVTFVARGPHLEVMRRSGPRLDSELGNLNLNPVVVVADPRDIAAADVILFAVKMGDTDGAARSLQPLVAKGATIFTFQNGIDSAERIGRIVGANSVVPGVGRILSHICEPGVIKQTGTFARLEFAESDNKPSARTMAFYEACKATGFEAVLSRNIQRELWMKFAMLAPNAAVTALARGPISIMRDNPQSRPLLVSLVEEAVA